MCFHAMPTKNLNNSERILSLVRRLKKTLPKFHDGRIDYTKATLVPVVTCFIRFKDRILLMKRSSKARYYPKQWNTVAGHLDEIKLPENKALDEVKEETGITRGDIASVSRAKPFYLNDKKLKRRWLIFPVVAELKRKPKVRLNWEHTQFRWIRPNELGRFHHVEKLDESMKRVLEETKNLPGRY